MESAEKWGEICGRADPCSLWKIGKNLLADGKRWTEIAALNEIENTIIHTGEVLKILE